MRPDALAARVAGTQRALDRHFGPGSHIEIISPSPILQQISVAVDQAVESTKRINPSLEEVRDFLGDCMRCQLCYSRTKLVFGVGNPHADLVVIGEAPGKQEDAKGEPFVGRSGHMLNNMLKNVIGVPREEVYILNVLKCRPPRDRDPGTDEVESCLPFLERQLAAIEPKVILLMGTTALRTLFDTKHGITRNRGTWREYQGIPVMPTFHPAFLLRKTRAEKRLTFSDLKALQTRYEELMGIAPDDENA